MIGAACVLTLDGERHKILVSQFGPQGTSTELIPSRVPGCTILVRKKIDQSIRASQILPYSHDVHAVLPEDVDLAFTKALVKIVDISLEVALTHAALVDGVHPQFETARIRGSVCSKRRGNIRTAWCGRRRRTSLSAPLPLGRFSRNDTEDHAGREHTAYNAKHELFLHKFSPFC